MSLFAALLLALVAWIVFDSLTAVLVVLAIAAVIIYISNNGNRRL